MDGGAAPATGGFEKETSLVLAKDSGGKKELSVRYNRGGASVCLDTLHFVRDGMTTCEGVRFPEQSHCTEGREGPSENESGGFKF